jgi:hypothetical protein
MIVLVFELVALQIDCNHWATSSFINSLDSYLPKIKNNAILKNPRI